MCACATHVAGRQAGRGRDVIALHVQVNALVLFSPTGSMAPFANFEYGGKRMDIAIAQDASASEIARTIKHVFGIAADADLHYTTEHDTPLAMGAAVATWGVGIVVTAEHPVKDWHEQRLAVANADTNTDGSSSMDGYCASDGGRSGGTALGLPAVPVAALPAQPAERRIALTVNTFHTHPVRDMDNPPVQHRKVYVVADSLSADALVKLVLETEGAHPTSAARSRV